MPMTDLLTTSQAAALAGVSRVRIHQWIRDGRLPVQRYGKAGSRAGVVLIRRSDLAKVERLPQGRPRKKAK